MKRSLSARVGQGGLLLLAATALMLSTTAGAYAPSASSSPDNLYDLPQLSGAENDLLNSDEPITVVLDASNGSVVAVDEETTTSFGTLSVTQNDCTGGKSCWHSSLAPGAYYGFTPGGTNSGTWIQRGKFLTGGYTSRPCWAVNSSIVCAEVFQGPGKFFDFNGSSVVGKRVEFK